MARVVEVTVRSGRLGPKRRLRVDLHGVSTFGPGKHHTLIRWEHISEIAWSEHAVTVASSRDRIIFPAGLFGLDAAELAARLAQAQSIFERADVIEELSRTES